MVRAIVVSADGKQIATCGNDNLVKLWNAADGKLIREFKGHESHVYNVAFHPDGKSLASCDLKANFKHWEIATGKCERDFKAEALHKYDTGFRADIGGARALAFSRDGKLLAAGGITNVTNAFAGIGNPAVARTRLESGKLKVLHVGKEAVNGVIWGSSNMPMATGSASPARVAREATCTFGSPRRLKSSSSSTSPTSVATCR